MTAKPRISSRPRAPTRRDPLGLYEPKRLNANSHWRFVNSRRLHYVASLGGRAPSPIEADIIDQLCRVGWDERVRRAEAESATDPSVRAELRRQVAELSRQLILLRRDLDRAAPRPQAPDAPQDPMGPLNDYLRRATVEREREQRDRVLEDRL